MKKYIFYCLILSMLFFTCFPAEEPTDEKKVINGPDIVVTYNNGTNIESTRTTVDFGTVNSSSPTSISILFTIKNNGNENLELNRDAVILTGDVAFSEDSSPVPSFTILPGESTDFSITLSYNRIKNGKTATVIIANNDSDENPFVFYVYGFEN
jgi:hypothetical protein